MIIIANIKVSHMSRINYITYTYTYITSILFYTVTISFILTEQCN